MAILNEILNVLKEMGKEFNEKIGVLTGQIQTLSKTLIDALSNPKSDSSESVSNLIEFNPELPEDPIVTEDLSKTNPDLSKTEVAKDDCRYGCKDKAYFYDEGVEEKTTHHNENLNVLKQIGVQINDLSETEVDKDDKAYFYDEAVEEKTIHVKGSSRHALDLKGTKREDFEKKEHKQKKKRKKKMGHKKKEWSNFEMT